MGRLIPDHLHQRTVLRNNTFRGIKICWRELNHSVYVTALHNK